MKARRVTVTGPKGKITKEFKHIACEIRHKQMKTKKQKGLHLELKMWFGAYKQMCTINTLKSLINNMIIGTTEVSRRFLTAPQGFRYKMRLVHAHFPINVSIPKDHSAIEIKNYLGGRHVHKIPMP